MESLPRSPTSSISSPKQVPVKTSLSSAATASSSSYASSINEANVDASNWISDQSGGSCNFADFSEQLLSFLDEDEDEDEDKDKDEVDNSENGAVKNVVGLGMKPAGTQISTRPLKGGRNRSKRPLIEEQCSRQVPKKICLANHILRERQRRDDMTSKFATLESLLPWRSKRDRTAIVEDAIQFVLERQKALKELEETRLRRSLLMATNTTNPHLLTLNTTMLESNNLNTDDGVAKINNYDIVPEATSQTKPTFYSKNQEKCHQFGDNSYRSQQSISNINNHMSGSHEDLNMIPQVNVHLVKPWQQEVIIEITYARTNLKSRSSLSSSLSSSPSFLSSIVQVLEEELQMDITNCNFCKVVQESMCVLIAKVFSIYPSITEKVASSLTYALSCNQ